MNKYDRVYAQINLDHMIKNINAIDCAITKDSKIMAVIKTDAYGHGAIPIANELESMDKIWGYGVATIEEGIILRKSGIKKNILILGYTFPYSYEQLFSYDITPTVFEYESARSIAQIADRLNKKMAIHIAVDTGMNRIGLFPNKEGLEIIKQISTLQFIYIEGIFTHFSKADEVDKTDAKRQLEAFQRFVSQVEKEIHITIAMKHSSNSAGAIQLSEANGNLIRAGIIIYGLWPSSEVNRETISLSPVLSLKSKIIFIKEVGKNQAVSYGGTFITNRNTKIATIPIGYGDGYPRSLSNNFYVLIRGKKAPILGRICMDQFMVDVTDIPEVACFDEVTLIGKDGDNEITTELLGDVSGRFNYEFVCDLGKRIPRVYKKEGVIIAQKDYYDDYSITINT